MSGFAGKERATDSSLSRTPTASDQTSPGHLRDENPILQLQRTLGNRAVMRLLRAKASKAEGHPPATKSKPPAATQAKLMVNAPGDAYGQDADRVAEQAAPTTIQLTPENQAGDCQTLQRDKAGAGTDDQWAEVVQAYTSLAFDIGMVNQKVMSPTRKDWVTSLSNDLMKIGGPGDLDEAALAREKEMLARYKGIINFYVAQAQQDWKGLWKDYEEQRAGLNDPRAQKILDRQANDTRDKTFFAWPYLTYDDTLELRVMLEKKSYYTMLDQQDFGEKWERERKGLNEAPQFHHFRIRALAGGQLSAGAIGADVTTFEIEEVGPHGRTGTITFQAEGVNAGLKAGAIGPQSWTDFDTSEKMRIEDFDGSGRITGVSGYFLIGGGYSWMTFHPRNKSSVEAKSWGWGLGLGGGAETVVGIWTVRQVDPE